MPFEFTVIDNKGINKNLRLYKLVAIGSSLINVPSQKYKVV
jgi:hypothetical protein